MFFFIIPKQEKKKIYTVLEFTKLEYCVNFFYFFIFKKVLEPGRLEYCVNGTRVYQAQVPQKNFNRINPTQQCHGGKLMRNSSL